MSEPFFDYINDRTSKVSNQLYGFEHKEKRYERLNYLSLDKEVDGEELGLVTALRNRRSNRDLGSKDNFSLDKLSQLLLLSLARDEENAGDKKFPFPSGGGTYPIETYVLVHKVDGLESGIYHYSSTTHSLALINSKVSLSLEELNLLHISELESMPPVVTLMTLVKSRVISKYGNLSYKLGLIEAGHRGQNICLVAAASNLATCPLGGGDSDKIHELLGVDGVNEHHIYSLAIGTTKDN